MNSQPGKALGIGIAVALVGIVALAIIDRANTEGVDGPSSSHVSVDDSAMQTAKGRNFLTSLQFMIQDRDQERAITQCDWASEALGKSRDNDEIFDWLEVIDACNEAVKGNWVAAQRALP